MRRVRFWLAKFICPPDHHIVRTENAQSYGGEPAIYVGRPTYTATSSWYSTPDGIYTFDGHKYVKVG